MKIGDLVTYQSSVYRWLLKSEEADERLLDLKLSGIRIQENDVCLVIDLNSVNGFQAKLVKLLTPRGIGWINTSWLLGVP